MIEFTCEVICPGIGFWEIFDHSLISVLVIGFHIISIPFWCSLSWTFLRICPFIPGCWFYWHIVAHILMILSISALSIVTTPFSCLIVLIWVFSPFLLMSMSIGLSILFIFSKEQLLVLLTFDIVSPFLVHLFLLWSLQFLLPFLLFFF